MNVTTPLVDEQLERGKENRSSEGRSSDTCLLVDEGDAVIGLSIAGGAEDNDIMDCCAQMCYDTIVLSTLPPDEGHDARLEYTETYMGCLQESGQPAAAAFFQTSATEPCGKLHAVHQGSGYGPASSSSSDGALPGGGNSPAERAFVDSLCDEPMPRVKDSNLPCPSSEDRGIKDTRFETIQSPAVSDPENDYSSVPSKEHIHCVRTPGELFGKANPPLGELSLRSALSDPITGTFMDDAMVAMCGHSFGGGSLQQVMETHACIICGATVPLSNLVPNLALRAAVMAYKHEDQLCQLSSMKEIKRRREAFEHPDSSETKGPTGGHLESTTNMYADISRSKGLHFPFAVGDRVLIKGNKRTPDRLFGREAVITSQCLNGWYLVRTLDTVESVRLQYRSLYRLGEMESPFAVEAGLFVEQHADACCSPLDIDNFKGCPSGNKSASDCGLESGSFTSEQENAMVPAAYPCFSPNGLKAKPVEREANAALKHVVVASDAGRNPELNDDSHYSSEALHGDQGRRNSNQINVVEVPSRSVEGLDEQLHAMVGPKSPGNVKSLDTVAQETGDDFVTCLTAAHVKSNDGQLLHDELQEVTGAKVCRGADEGYPEGPPLRSGPPNLASTVEDARDAVKLPVGDGEHGNSKSFRKRSRRTASHFKKNSVISGGFVQDSDPYRKVYSSCSRRRSGKNDSMVTVIPGHLPRDNNPFFRGETRTGKHSEKVQSERFPFSTSGAAKQVREVKLPSGPEILQIMRKDVLKLEKQIPQEYMICSWGSNRIDWRKHVKTSLTVSDLGAQVRLLRYSLLLTTAGGMSDEEWDTRIALIIESGDVESLVSLWGRLYSDVYKLLESRPKFLQDLQFGKSSPHDMQDSNTHEPHLSERSASTVYLTTSATLAAVNALAHGQQDPDATIKALIASTMRFLQQQSRAELSLVREVLEREKRHISAKLAHLEGTFANMGGILKSKAEDPAHQTDRLTSSQSKNNQISSKISLNQGCANLSRHGYETESESDTALPIQAEDGEATDMSDSD